ncbi:hypothetical protein [Streptomyces synnematoformans]|uniref:Integral membrane protein n=1 Tax=Streptomyces synnematoformans TaxID=415721 RepID=A0ABP5J569_9ACTN
MAYLDVDLLHTFASAVPADLAQAPNPKGGENPPGWGKMVKVLRWGFRGATLLFVGCVVWVSVLIAASFHRGESREHVSGLGKVLLGCIIAGSSSGIVSVLI